MPHSPFAIRQALLANPEYARFEAAMAVRGVAEVNYCSASSGECHGGFFGVAEDFGPTLVTADELPRVQAAYRADAAQQVVNWRADTMPQVVKVLALQDQDHQVVAEIICDVEVHTLRPEQAEDDGCEAAPEAELEGAPASSEGAVTAYKYTDPVYEPTAEYMASLDGEGEAAAPTEPSTLQPAAQEEAETDEAGF